MHRDERIYGAPETLDPLMVSKRWRIPSEDPGAGLRGLPTGPGLTDLYVEGIPRPEDDE